METGVDNPLIPPLLPRKQGRRAKYSQRIVGFRNKALSIRHEVDFFVGAVTEGFIGRTTAAAEPFVRALINGFTLVVQDGEVAGNMQ